MAGNSNRFRETQLKVETYFNSDVLVNDETFMNREMYKYNSQGEYVNAEIAMRDFMILGTPSNTAYQAMHRVNSASDLPGEVEIKTSKYSLLISVSKGERLSFPSPGSRVHPSLLPV